jgi:hypothetical protein
VLAHLYPKLVQHGLTTFLSPDVMRHQAGSACARELPTCIAGRKSRSRPTTATLQALASVEDTTSLGELAARLCRPTRHNGRRVRALNPHAPADAALLSAISRGEFTLNGFRNRDLRTLLFNKALASKSERHRQAAAVSRKLPLLRAHHLIRKVPCTHRYLLTKAGRIAVTALIAARIANTHELTRLAA